MSLSLEVQHPAGTGDPVTVELPAEIFDVDANIALIHQVVVGQLAAARQGTHSTKRRGEVRGGGKKPYRQKGTGRARQGSTRAPQFVGGGVVHGPHPHSYEQRTPKKMKAAALRQALSDRARNGHVHVVSSLVGGGAPSTRLASESIFSISSAKHVLVVAGRDDQVSWKSLRNVDAVHLIEPGQLNTYDVLVSDDVVFTQEALEQFVETRGNGATLIVTAGQAAPAEKVAPEKAPAKKAAAKVVAPAAADGDEDVATDAEEDEA